MERPIIPIVTYIYLICLQCPQKTKHRFTCEYTNLYKKKKNSSGTKLLKGKHTPKNEAKQIFSTIYIYTRGGVGIKHEREGSFNCLLKVYVLE